MELTLQSLHQLKILSVIYNSPPLVPTVFCTYASLMTDLTLKQLKQFEPFPRFHDSCQYCMFLFNLLKITTGTFFSKIMDSLFFAKLKRHFHSRPWRELPKLNSCDSPEVWTRWPNSLGMIQPWSGSFSANWATISTRVYSRRPGWVSWSWVHSLRSGWGAWVSLRAPPGGFWLVPNAATAVRNSMYKRSFWNWRISKWKNKNPLFPLHGPLALQPKLLSTRTTGRLPFWLFEIPFPELFLSVKKCYLIHFRTIHSRKKQHGNCTACMYTSSTSLCTLQAQVYVHLKHEFMYTASTSLCILQAQVYVHFKHKYSICTLQARVYVHFKHEFMYTSSTSLCTLQARVYVHFKHEFMYPSSTSLCTPQARVYVHVKHEYMYTSSTSLCTLQALVYVHFKHEFMLLYTSSTSICTRQARVYVHCKHKFMFI